MSNRGTLVYVAGPFRAPHNWGIEENIRRAERLALDVWAAGYTALCPHCNTRFFQGALPDEIWLEGDLEMLRRCDAVVLTEDWRKSSGARAEVMSAQNHGIPVYESVVALALGQQMKFDAA